MKIRILDSRAQVYSSPDAMSPLLVELKTGEEVNAGSIKKVGEESWLAVTLSDGRSGFISGSTRAAQVQLVSVLQNKVTAYVQPSTSAPTTKEYSRGAQFYLLGTTDEAGVSWVKIRDNSGTEGFIPGNTKIAQVGSGVSGGSEREAGKRNMLFGALWCIGGSVVTCIGFSMASGGGSYFIFWGAIIFGAIQFIRGLIQFLNAKD